MKILVLYAGLACHYWLNPGSESYIPLRFPHIFSSKPLYGSIIDIQTTIHQQMNGSSHRGLVVNESD